MGLSKISKVLPYALSQSKKIFSGQPTSSFPERVPHDGLQPFVASEIAIWTNELKRGRNLKTRKEMSRRSTVSLTSVLNILVFKVLLDWPNGVFVIDFKNYAFDNSQYNFEYNIVLGYLTVWKHWWDFQATF